MRLTVWVEYLKSSKFRKITIPFALTVRDKSVSACFYEVGRSLHTDITG
jgi:hypothetical protein